MKVRNIALVELKEHPKNKEYFRDISEISEEMWETFKNNINELGMIEPLIVDEITMEVISGHQRLKALKENGQESAPCVLVNESGDKILKMMISSNVMRRELDPFTMFEYISMLRKGGSGQGITSSAGEEVKTTDDLTKQTGKGRNFVTGANIWYSLSDDEKKMLKEWYWEESQKGDAPNQEELLKEMKELKIASLTANKTIEDLKADIKAKKEELTKLKKDLKDGKEFSAEEIRKAKTELGILRKQISEEGKAEKAFESLKKQTDGMVGYMQKVSSAMGSFVSAADKIDGAQIRGLNQAKIALCMRDIQERMKQVGKYIDIWGNEYEQIGE